MLKRFLNLQDKFVSEAIDGLITSSQGAHLARLDAGGGIQLCFASTFRLTALP